VHLRRGFTIAASLTAGLALAALVAPPAQSMSAPLTQVVSDDPVDNTPHVVDGTVYAIAEVGNLVVVGGNFDEVREDGSGTIQNVNNIFAYDPDTGEVDPGFKPNLDNTVDTVAAAPSGNAVIVGGYFGKVNGANWRGLAMLSLADGSRVQSFVGKTNAAVHKVLVRGSRLFVGGRFDSINGVDRTGLAVLNSTTGALDTSFTIEIAESRKPGIQPKPLVEEMDATKNGKRLIIVGNFLKVGGISHQQVAMINPANNAVLKFNSPRFNSLCGSSLAHFFSDVEIDPTGTYFALVSRGGYSQNDLCDTVTRWEMTPKKAKAQPTWINWTGGDTLWSVAVTPAAIYMGGHQRWLDNFGCNNEACPGAVEREGIAAVSPVDGSVLPWNPGRSRGVGAQELVATLRGLYVGSDTERLGGETHGRIGMFPSQG